MKRSNKFYKDKELKRRVRETQEYSKMTPHYYWKHVGYNIIMVPSRAARKHPLYKELVEILPLVANIDHREEPEASNYRFYSIKKELYIKLTSLQKCCFIKEIIPTEELPVVVNIPEFYILDPQLKELLVPRITKNYRLTYTYTIDNSLQRKMIRDNIWALMSPNDREDDKLGRKAKHKKALIKHAKEEIMEML